MKNATISTRLWFGFLTILLMLLLLSGFSIMKVNAIASALHAVNDVNSVKQRYAINFRGSMHNRAILLRDVVLVSDKDDLRRTLDDIQKQQDDYQASAVAMDDMFAKGIAVTDDERAVLASIKHNEAVTMPVAARVVSLKLAGRQDEAHQLLMTEARPDYIVWLRSINQFIDLEEAKNHKVGRKAQTDAQDFALSMVLLCGVAILVGCGMMAWAMRSMRPLRVLTDTMKRLSNRDLGAEVVGTDRRDEIGAMAQAVQIFKNGIIEADALATAQDADRRDKEERARRLDALMMAFETTIGQTVGLLSESSAEMETTAQVMSSTATNAKEQAGHVALAADTASAGAETVASAAEELSSSVGEINRQVTQSARVSSGAVAEARRTDTVVQALSAGARKIGEVVSLIADIASQTNLLALNATIEAARAGEAGRGFAVVASEVKNLAGQTARATEEIAAQINAVQSATTDAVEAIRGITTVIEEVGTIATAISAAVEEQGAATSEITRNVQRTATSTQTMTTSIGMVRQAANDTGDAASQVLGAAKGLSRQAEGLSREVQDFIAGVRGVR